jgi:hypothetical protein
MSERKSIAQQEDRFCSFVICPNISRCEAGKHGPNMFEITAEDIALLNDVDLRSLVGRLCESEMRRRGISPSCVTWGGNQNAGDGGLDVRVALPNHVETEDFIPRPETGFQVKTEDTPASKISSEMRPTGTLRPAIRELAERSGAYIIVSSKGSTSDFALQSRRDAMAQALSDVPNAERLKLDFYDRRRLETWLRDHPGTALWVREKIGKPLRGWSGYAAWSYQKEGLDSQYFLDNQVRIKGRKQGSNGGMAAVEGANAIRDVLRNPHGVVRLTGLSGVGKTRLVQALFDDRIGDRALDPSLAVYANLGHGPDPQPTALASELIVNRKRAVIIVDNCPPDLHQHLSELCRSGPSLLSLVTVEYDIQEDHAEGTDVFVLEAASVDLTEILIKHRFQTLSQLDARRIADFSGGNARVAIALADTIDSNETIAQLSDQELFRRLFHQRRQPDERLFAAAQGLSLVYSFQGEDVSSEGAELECLGTLVGQDANEMFAHCAELERRGLVQRRGPWRAVLPQAIANQLASLALQNIPPSSVENSFLAGGRERLLKSFSRRLSFLHSSKEAQAITANWLSPNGFLKDLPDFNDLGNAIFNNISRTAPDQALAALERVLLKPKDPEVAVRCKRYLRLLRLLVYEPAPFDRGTALIVNIAETEEVTERSDEARKIFASLFTICYSGTHAPLEKRLAIIESLVDSENPKKRALGLAALEAALEAANFGPGWDFEFGAHSRDYGYWPSLRADVKRWFGQVLSLGANLSCSDKPVAAEVRSLLARQFRGLWSCAAMYDELEQVCRQISAKHFWKEGWIAVRRTIHYDAKGLQPEVSERLALLDDLLRPKDLLEKVRAIVLSDGLSGVGLGAADDRLEGVELYNRVPAEAEVLGREIVRNKGAFEQLLPELFASRDQLWSFGRGLAEGTLEPRGTWERLVTAWAVPSQKRSDVRVLHGFLNGLNMKDPEIADVLLESSVEDGRLAPVYPVLQTAVEIRERGAKRLLRSLELGKAPIQNYRNLLSGGATHNLSGHDFNKLLLGIAAEPDGADIAIEILCMRISHARNQSSDSELIDIGCQLMDQLPISQRNGADDYRIGIVARACLLGERGATAVGKFCRKLRDAISRSETYAFYHADVLQILFSVQPLAALDGFCGGDQTELKIGARILKEAAQMRRNPFDTIPEADLLTWCDQHPDTRYPVAAGGVTPFRSSGGAGSQQWTGIAHKLWEKAPDRIAVLKEFIDKFVPTGWSGSRAAIVESNARLLDDLETYSDPVLIEFIAEEKARLADTMEDEHRIQHWMDRERDERFE